jgi:hypothetical protein
MPADEVTRRLFPHHGIAPQNELLRHAVGEAESSFGKACVEYINDEASKLNPSRSRNHSKPKAQQPMVRPDEPIHTVPNTPCVSVADSHALHSVRSLASNASWGSATARRAQIREQQNASRIAEVEQKQISKQKETSFKSKYSPAKRKRSSPLPKEKVRELVKNTAFRFEDVDLLDSLDVSTLKVTSFASQEKAHKTQEAQKRDHVKQEPTFLKEEFPSDDSLDGESDAHLVSEGDETSHETILPSMQQETIREEVIQHGSVEQDSVQKDFVDTRKGDVLFPDAVNFKTVTDKLPKNIGELYDARPTQPVKNSVESAVAAQGQAARAIANAKRLLAESSDCDRSSRYGGSDKHSTFSRSGLLDESFTNSFLRNEEQDTSDMVRYEDSPLKL